MPAIEQNDRAIDRFVHREEVRESVARVTQRHVADCPLGTPPPSDDADIAQLRARLVRYVSRRRADGMPLERLLTELQSLVVDAEAAEGVHEGGEALTERVLRWSVAAYVDEPTMQHVPRFY